MVMKRSMMITSPKYSFPDGVMRDKAPGNVATGVVTVYDQDNNVVAGVGISPSVSVRAPVYPYFTVTVPAGTLTDATGKASFSVNALTKDSKANWLTNPTKQPLYMEGGDSGSYNEFVGTEIFDTPVQLYLGMEVTPVIGAFTTPATAKAHLYDETGAAVANTNVSFTADVGSLSSATSKTDANGNATVTYTPALGNKTLFDIATIQTQALLEGYGPASSAFSIVAYTMKPEVTQLSIPTTGYKTTNVTFSITGKVSATAGVGKVNYTLDTSTTPVNLTVGTDGSFTIPLTNLAVGTHTLHINMVDAKGNPSAKVVTFTVEKAAKKKEKAFPWLYVIIIIIVIVLILIVAMMMMGGGKKAETKPEAMPEEKKEEPKAGGGS
jgi:cell division protein FtsL